MKFAVLGMGRVGHTLACYLLDKKQQVSVWDRDVHKREVLRIKGISISGVLEGHFTPRVMDSVKAAIDGVEYIIIATIANGHKEIAGMLKGCLSKGQSILVMNSNWAVYELKQVLEDEIDLKNIIISETGGVHLMSDLLEPGICLLKRIKKKIAYACYPSTMTAATIDNLSKVFPQLEAAESVIQTSLNATNPILHAPITLFGFSKIEEGVDFFFYKEGGTPHVVAYIEKIDAERMDIIKFLKIKGASCLEIVNTAWNTSFDNLHDAIQFNYSGSKGPKSIHHRFVTEDIPYGIVPISKLGKLYGIPTPYTDSLIDIYSKFMDEDYFKQGPVFDKESIRKILSCLLMGNE